MNRSQGFALLGLLLALAAVSLGQAQDRAQAPATEDLKALVQGNNAFALDLYRLLSAKGGNVVFSPYSISTALAMTYAGARGQTTEQMAQVLHFSLPQERLHQAFGGLIGQLQGERKGQPYQLLVANALWDQWESRGVVTEVGTGPREDDPADVLQWPGGGRAAGHAPLSGVGAAGEAGAGSLLVGVV